METTVGGNRRLARGRNGYGHLLALLAVILGLGGILFDVVPEPNPAVLLSLGAAGLLGAGWPRRSTAPAPN